MEFRVGIQLVATGSIAAKGRNMRGEIRWTLEVSTLNDQLAGYPQCEHQR